MNTRTAALLSPASSAPCAANAAPDAAPASRAGLFSFLDHSHQEIQRMLLGLQDVVQAMNMDGLTPEVREHARTLLAWFNTHAREHHVDEERHVFPALLTSHDEAMRTVAERLMQDHCWLEEDWLQIAPSLSAAADGFQWFDLDVLRHAVDVFSQLYVDHIVLEESVAYPQARRSISELDAAGMGVEMARRRAQREARAG